MCYALVSSLPTTSQGLSIVNDVTAPEVGIVVTGAALVFWLQVFLQSFNSLARRDPACCPTFFNITSFNIVLMLGFISHWIYVVVTIEQTIQKNPVIHNGPRFPISFGQVCCSFHVDYYVC